MAEPGFAELQAFAAKILKGLTSVTEMFESIIDGGDRETQPEPYPNGRCPACGWGLNPDGSHPLDPDNDCPDGSIAEMDRAINALALELPAPVWEDVRARWQAVKDLNNL